MIDLYRCDIVSNHDLSRILHRCAVIICSAIQADQLNLFFEPSTRTIHPEGFTRHLSRFKFHSQLFIVRIAPECRTQGKQKACMIQYKSVTDISGTIFPSSEQNQKKNSLKIYEDNYEKYGMGKGPVSCNAYPDA